MQVQISQMEKLTSMSLKSLIIPRIADARFSQDRLETLRTKFEQARSKAGDDHTVEFFHDPSDPYSQLLETVLHEFTAKYNITLISHRLARRQIVQPQSVRNSNTMPKRMRYASPKKPASISNLWTRRQP